MRDDAKAQRKAQIEAAAYDLLAEKGFQNMSMLAVAKAAKASNETLYRWYGDKVGLFQALIETNADRVADRLTDRLTDATDPKSALTDLGPNLLAMLLSDRAVALNQAAASDATGTLGKVLAEQGRGKVFPLIVDLFKRLTDNKVLTGHPVDLATLYVDLLVGDLQIRRATGALGPLTDSVMTDRAQKAEARLMTLAGVS
ncbi:TetR/AcrR family transcriptional regulator [Marivita sp.]|uniref:TetR/AcrR family transcriptional regulator n=1 Tax=Marivita sp. TaxID=2003365 RepID=UPI003F6D6D12